MGFSFRSLPFCYCYFLVPAFLAPGAGFSLQVGANTVLYEFHETVITVPAGGPNSKPMCHPYILTSRRGDHPVSSKGYAGRLRKGSKTLGHAEWHRSWKRQTVSRSHVLVDGWWMRRRNPKKSCMGHSCTPNQTDSGGRQFGECISSGKTSRMLF